MEGRREIATSKQAVNGPRGLGHLNVLYGSSAYTQACIGSVRVVVAVLCIACSVCALAAHTRYEEACVLSRLVSLYAIVPF